VVVLVGYVVIQGAAQGAARWDWDELTFTSYSVTDVVQLGADVPTGLVISDCRPAPGRDGCDGLVEASTVRAVVATALDAPERIVARDLRISAEPKDIGFLDTWDNTEDMCGTEAGDTTHAQRAAGVHNLAIINGAKWRYRIVATERRLFTGQIVSTETSDALIAVDPLVDTSSKNKGSSADYNCRLMTPPWANGHPNLVETGQLPASPAQ
jgi:hypothetical protein